MTTPRTDAEIKRQEDWAEEAQADTYDCWMETFKFARQLETELIALQDLVDLQKDEFTRIKNIASQENNVFMKEIVGLCERSEQVITQNVSVIKQRDNAVKAYEATKAWSHLLNDKLVTLLDRCNDYADGAPDSTPLAKFCNEMIGLCNAIDLKEVQTLRKERDQLLATVEGLRNSLLDVKLFLENIHANGRPHSGMGNVAYPDGCECDQCGAYDSIESEAEQIDNALQSLPPTNLVKRSVLEKLVNSVIECGASNDHFKLNQVMEEAHEELQRASK